MYRVIIADSEYHTSSQNGYSIDWNSEGFDVVCTAQSLSEAISYISSSPADLVFTDMDFPDGKGYDLIKYIQFKCPYAKIVVVSNNTDFTSLKSAFSLDVFDYIKKSSLNSYEIIKILERFKASESRTVPDEPTQFLSEAGSYITYRKKIINTLTGKAPAIEVNGMLIAALKIFNFQLLRQIHSPDDLSILVQNIISTIMQVIRNPVPVVYQNNSNNIIICMQFDKNMPETSIMNNINSYVRRINFLTKKFFNLSLSWGISSLSSETHSVTDCYREAVDMLEDTPIAERKERFDIPKLSSISLDEEKKVLSAIQTLDYDSIDRCLDAIFAERIHTNMPVHLLTGELITIANKLCAELNIDLARSAEGLFQTSLITEDENDAAAELEWCKNLFHIIIRMHMEHTRPSRHSTYARFVRTYIADNYKEDISLKAIAENMGITEQHLSKIFKDETGEKLSAYLNRFRIDKAKELLETDVNIKYLYSEVGFKNYNYFFVAFKKSVGCTPVEYKRSHVRKKDIFI